MEVKKLQPVAVTEMHLSNLAKSLKMQWYLTQIYRRLQKRGFSEKNFPKDFLSAELRRQI